MDFRIFSKLSTLAKFFSAIKPLHVLKLKNAKCGVYPLNKVISGKWIARSHSISLLIFCKCHSRIIHKLQPEFLTGLT